MRRRLFVFSAIVAMLILCVGCISAFADDVHHTITFHGGDGGVFSNGTSVNAVGYAEGHSIVKYSHTANVSDNGIDHTNYSSNLLYNEVVTLPSVDYLHVKVTVGFPQSTTGNRSFLCVWDGDCYYSMSANNTADRAQSIVGVLSGEDWTDSANTVEFDVVGDTVTFGVMTGYPPSGKDCYGYYAIITGISQTVVSGNYEIPYAGREKRFVQWNTEPDGSGDMISDVGLISEDTDLYAVYEDAVSGVYRNVNWSIQENGRLIIGIDGEEQVFADVDSQSVTDWPWYNQDIQSVEFAGTVYGTGLMNGMFYNSQRLTTFNPTGFDTSNVTSMREMFSRCLKLSSIDLSSMDMYSVTDVGLMFHGCVSLAHAGIESWDVSSVKKFDGFINVEYTDRDHAAHIESLDLSSWDVSSAVNMNNMFRERAIGTLNLTGWDVSNVVEASNMFRDCTGHIIAPNFHWDSLVSTSLYSGPQLFYGSGAGSILEVPGWSFGKVASMYYMFAFSNAQYINASDWDVTGAVSLSSMFRQQNGQNEFVDASGMHSDTVTDMSEMFKYGSAVVKIDVSDFDFPAATSMYQMFFYDNELKEIIGLDTWSTDSVTNMNSLFGCCFKLESVSVNSWNVANVTNMNSLFSSCQAFKEIDLSSWDLSSVTDSSYMFNGCLYLESVVVGEKFKFTGTESSFPRANGSSATWEREDGAYGPFVYSEVAEKWTPEMAGKWIWGAVVYAAIEDDSFVFFRSREEPKVGNVISDRSLADLDGVVHHFDTYYANVENLTEAPWRKRFAYVSRVYSTGLGGRLVKPKTCANWFYDWWGSIPNIVSCDLSQFDMSECVSTRYMFYNCSKMTELILGDWTNNAITDTSYMFEYCTKLETLDVSSFGTDNVVTMEGMFYGCGAKSLDVSGFNTENVTSMRYTFFACTNLTDLDVSMWNTSAVTTMYEAFGNCNNLVKLNVSGIDTSHVTDMGYVFAYSPLIDYLDLSSFDCSMVSNTYMSSMFYGCSSLKMVKLGEVNPFLGVHPQYAVLPTPPMVKDGVTYTQKWIHESGEYGPYSPQELTDNYTSEMSGIWVWENAGDMYTIIFDTDDEDAVGGWPNQLLSIAEEYRIPKNVYRKFGHVIDHWEDNRGNSYEDHGLVPANRFALNNVVTLKAIFAPSDSSVTMQGGSFEVRLHGNEKAFFDGIPTGTSYQVYEQTPEGWVLIQYEDATGQIRYMTESESKFVNEYKPDVIAVQLNGLKVLDGVPVEAGSYSFQLLDADKNVLQTVDVLDGGLIQFDPIEFTRDEVGVYQYYIREVLGNETLINYDTHEESITIDVHENLGEPIVKYLYSSNLNSDGEKISDYNNYQYYTGAVKIDGADRIHVKVVHSNPRGQFYIWPGDYSDELSRFTATSSYYSSTFNPGSPGVITVPYQNGKDHELVTDEYDIEGNAISVVWSCNAFTPSQGYYPDGPYSDMVDYGYYITVSYAEHELVADVSRDDDGIVFQNEHKPGKLILEKVGSDVAPENVVFYYDVEFIYENGQPYEVPDVSLAYEERDGKRSDYPDILLPEEKPKYMLTVNHIYVDVDGHEETTTETSEYYARSVFTVTRVEQPGYLYGRIVGNNLVQSNSTSWKGIMPENDAIVDVYYYAQRPVTGSVVWNDQDNWGGIRPSSVTVHLLKDDLSVAYQTITADDGWAFSFDNMPVYDNGTLIEYEVTMEDVDDYEIGVEGTTITASHRAYWTYTFHNYDYQTHEPLVMTYLDQTGADIVIKLACDKPYSFEIDSAPAGYNRGALNVDGTIQYGLFQGTMTKDEELDLYWERGTELPSAGGATLRLDVEHPNTVRLSVASDAAVENMPLEGSVYSIYKIGNLSGDLEFEVFDAFASLNVMDRLESGTNTRTLVSDILRIVRQQNMEPVMTLRVAADGSVGATHIDDGLYVMTMTQAATGLDSYDVIFPMPYYSKEFDGIRYGGIVICEYYAYNAPTDPPSNSPTPSPTPSPSPTSPPTNTTLPPPPPSSGS